VRTEREDGGHASGSPGRLDGGFDHGAVPEVHAVEHPNRKVKRPVPGNRNAGGLD
jgi:hypothetical protein